MTETGCIASINPYYGERKVGSIGLPIRGQQMKIVDQETGEPAETGAFGEIMMRGPNIMIGYLHNPEATAESIRDGWLYSGDIGYVDEDGYFFIVDRTKDMIIRGGENIYPREIEEVIYEHEGVLECAVIGIPDPVRGEEVLAVVVAKEGVSLDADELARTVPSGWRSTSCRSALSSRRELPKTPTGKISKGPLRDEFGSWQAAQAASRG